MNTQLPLLLFLSGMTGVGKSTLAQKILKKNPSYIIIEEVDIIREALRAFVNSNEEIINIPNEYQSIINKASYELTYNEYIDQCKLLQPSIFGICNRLQRKKISAIIEGVNIDYISMFENTQINLHTFKNYICINLHISDSKTYQSRLYEKYQKYGNPDIAFWDKIIYRSHLCYNKLNDYILQNSKYNIFNIDVYSNICTPSPTSIVNQFLTL